MDAVCIVKGSWRCKGIESGMEFNELELDENLEWTDYDEKVNHEFSCIPDL